MPTNGELGDNHEVHHTGIDNIYNIYTDINTQYKLIIIRAQRVIFAVGFKKQSESHSKSCPCITHPLKFAFALPLLQTATIIAPVKYFLKNIFKVIGLL